MVGVEAREHVLKGGAHLLDVAGALVLAGGLGGLLQVVAGALVGSRVDGSGLPGGPDVALDDPLLAVLLDGVADEAAHTRVAHPAIKDVDAVGACVVENGLGLIGSHVGRDPLSAEADLAHHKAGLAEGAVVHRGSPLPWVAPAL